jgi:hypothetical protein
MTTIVQRAAAVARAVSPVLLALVLGAVPLQAQQEPAGCAAADFHVLDFWVGRWDVFVGKQLVGRDQVAKLLDDCAVTEEWTGLNGERGNSLFYYLPAARTWKQVWVTNRALAPGGVKEKTLTARLPDGGVQFQGEIAQRNGGVYLDRTTLTPLENGDVRQVIAMSTDGGLTWETTFDGLYVREKEEGL